MADDSLFQELPFSPLLIDLYKQWQNSSREERTQLSLELAATFCVEHDPTDTTLSEEYHEVFEVFLESQLRFEAEAMRLSRIAERRITEYLKEHNIDLDKVVVESPPTN